MGIQLKKCLNRQRLSVPLRSQSVSWLIPTTSSQLSRTMRRTQSPPPRSSRIPESRTTQKLHRVPGEEHAHSRISFPAAEQDNRAPGILGECEDEAGARAQPELRV